MKVLAILETAQDTRHKAGKNISLHFSYLTIQLFDDFTKRTGMLMIEMKTKPDLFKPAFTILLAMCIFFSLLGSGNAHRVNVFAWVDGDTVLVESKFSGGKKVKNGKVTVTDARGVELLSGVTDENGEFSFSVPQRTELKIILEAGAGHRGEWKIPLEELEAVTTRSGNLNQKTGQPPADIADTDQETPPTDNPSGPAPGLAEIELMVEKALDKKLKPIIKMLVDSQQKGPTAKDIFAGIGYIVGLIGIAAYVHSRRRK